MNMKMCNVDLSRSLNLCSPKGILPCPYGTENVYRIINGNIYIVDENACYGICIEALNDLDSKLIDFTFDKKDYVNHLGKVLSTGDAEYKLIHFGTYVIGVRFDNRLYVHSNWIGMLS